MGKIFKPALKKLENLGAMESALLEAGVTFTRVTVEDDKSRGLVVDVLLASSASAEAARQTHGRIAFPVSIR